MDEQRKVSETADRVPCSAMEYILMTWPDQFELKYFHIFGRIDSSSYKPFDFERYEPRFEVYGPKKGTDVQPGDIHLIVGHPKFDVGLARRFSGLQFDELQIIAMQLTSYKICGDQYHHEQWIAQELGRMTLEHMVRANSDLSTLEETPTLSYGGFKSEREDIYTNTYQIICVPQSTKHIHGLFSVAKSFHESEEKMKQRLSEFDRQKQEAQSQLLNEIGNELGLPNNRQELLGCDHHLTSARPKDFRYDTLLIL